MRSKSRGQNRGVRRALIIRLCMNAKNKFENNKEKIGIEKVTFYYAVLNSREQRLASFFILVRPP